jgi:hypothetical protein
MIILKTNKATLYAVNVRGGLERYALAVLQLTNLKSSVDDSVLNIKTLSGTHIIEVVSLADIGDMLRQYGEITRQEEVTVIPVSGHDLPGKVLNQMDCEDEAGNDFFLQYEFFGEF